MLYAQGFLGTWGISSFGKVSNSSFGMAGVSSFGNIESSGFGNVGNSGFGIFGNSGFGRVGSSGFGISGNSGLEKIEIFGNCGNYGLGSSLWVTLRRCPGLLELCSYLLMTK